VINVQLIHAQAEQQPLYRQLQAQPERDGNESGLIAQKWFQNRRRALLSPFAVGTIDQAMLAVLQTRHHFVRQYGLSHKVILFDEIHSYDTYMNQIIKHLLKWLAALDSPIILLSATLSQETRQELLAQVGVTDSIQKEAAYPRLTIVDRECNVHVHTLPAPPIWRLRLYHLLAQDLIHWLFPSCTTPFRVEERVKEVVQKRCDSVRRLLVTVVRVATKTIATEKQWLRSAVAREY
jgi:hypothetical protein